MFLLGPAESGDGWKTALDVDFQLLNILLLWF